MPLKKVEVEGTLLADAERLWPCFLGLLREAAASARGESVASSVRLAPAGAAGALVADREAPLLLLPTASAPKRRGRSSLLVKYEELLAVSEGDEAALRAVLGLCDARAGGT